MNITGSLTQVLPIEDSSQIGHARRTAQKLAEQHGFDENDAGRVALVATELASNVLKHAQRGEFHLRVLTRPDNGFGIEMQTVDRAQGFDLDACLADGFSTGGTQGIGLGAVSRQTNVFDVYADHRGAVLLARIFPRSDRQADIRFGVSQHSLYVWKRQLARQVSGDAGKDAEIRQLKRELTRVTEERDILKKATAYFARDAK